MTRIYSVLFYHLGSVRRISSHENYYSVIKMSSFRFLFAQMLTLNIFSLPFGEKSRYNKSIIYF
jgi:hypothetical protein